MFFARVVSRVRVLFVQKNREIGLICATQGSKNENKGKLKILMVPFLLIKWGTFTNWRGIYFHNAPPRWNPVLCHHKLFFFCYNIVSKFSGKGSHVSRRYQRALISKYLINLHIKCTKRPHITGTSIDIHVKPTPCKWFVSNIPQKITRNCTFLLHYQSVNQI